MQLSKRTITCGFTRGLLEFRQNFSMIINYVLFPSIALFVMYLLRGYSISDTQMSLGYYSIPGIIAMNILFTGMMGIASTLLTEREEGILMRVRAIPHGTDAYFIGKLICQIMLTLASFTVVLTFSLFLFDDLFPNLFQSIFTLLWLLPLGIVSILPLGVALGSLLKNPRHLSYISLSLLVMTSISGVFYPLAKQADALQLIGQSSPLYWMGHTLRFAMLPHGAEATEISGQWNLLGSIIIMTIWAIVGSATALYALKRISPYPLSSRSR